MKEKEGKKKKANIFCQDQRHFHFYLKIKISQDTGWVHKACLLQTNQSHRSQDKSPLFPFLSFKKKVHTFL